MSDVYGETSLPTNGSAGGGRRGLLVLYGGPYLNGIHGRPRLAFLRCIKSGEVKCSVLSSISQASGAMPEKGLIRTFGVSIAANQIS